MKSTHSWIRMMLLAAVAAGCAATEAPAQTDVQLPEVYYKRLLNDLQVGVASTRHLGDDLTIGLVLRYGSAFDPSGKAGLTTLLTRMFKKATLDKSAKNIQDELDYLGASIEVTSDWDGIRFVLRGRGAGFERSLLILYQVVAEAQFLEEDFVQVRSELLEDLGKPEDPRQRLRSQFEMMLYSGMTYGRPLQGTAETIANISVGDVRYFYNRYFSPNAATLVFVGSTDSDVVLQKATRIWGIWVRKDEVPFTFIPPRKPASRIVYLEDDPASPAAQFILGNLWPRREEPEYYAGGLAARALQERLTAVLPTSLLTVGYEGRRMPGPFYVQGQAAAEQALGEIQRIFEAVGSIQGNPYSDEELARARESWVSEFNRAATTTAGVCDLMMDAELYRLGTHYAANFPSLLRRHSAAQVREAAKNWIFPGGVVIVVRGPASILKEGLQSLGNLQELASPD